MQVPYNIKILVGVLAPCTNVHSARNFNFASTDLLAKIAKYLSTMKISTYVIVDCTKNGALFNRKGLRMKQLGSLSDTHMPCY